MTKDEDIEDAITRSHKAIQLFLRVSRVQEKQSIILFVQTVFIFALVLKWILGG